MFCFLVRIYSFFKKRRINYEVMDGNNLIFLFYFCFKGINDVRKDDMLS